MRSIFLAFFTLTAVTAAAQTPRDARAIVPIVDVTGPILPGATVTITPRGLPARAVVVSATDAGVATMSGIKPGRYTIKAEFPGFDAIELDDVRLRSRDVIRSFLQATSVSNPRQVDISIRFNF